MRHIIYSLEKSTSRCAAGQRAAAHTRQTRETTQEICILLRQLEFYP